MQTGSSTSSFSVGGLAFTSTVSRQGEGIVGHVVDIPAGVAGAISATGVDGLADGHGILDTDVIDVHWTDPSDGTHKCRRGIAVDTSSANAITFDNDPAAEGDALPAEDTDVIVSVQVVIETEWDGDDVEMIACKATQRAIADFRSAAASLMAAKLPSGEAWSWASGQGTTNPLTGDPVASVVISNGSTTAAIFSLGLLYQSVP
jgi:hypothetical protein